MANTVKNRLKKIKPLYNIWHNMRLSINRNKEKKKVEAFRKYGHEILKDISQIIIENKYQCGCIEGTLLGLIRDDRLIPWDDDLDFVILDTNDFSWEEFGNKMAQAGFWKYREIKDNGKIVTVSYKKKDVLCDFSLWKSSGLEMVIPYGVYEIPGYEYINGEAGKYRVWDCTIPTIKEMIIEHRGGILVSIPANYEMLLAAIYGENWRIPDPDFRLDKDEYEKEYIITYYKKSLFKR